MAELVVRKSARERARLLLGIHFHLPGGGCLDHRRPDDTPFRVLDGGKGKMPAVGHGTDLTETLAFDAVARPARIQTQICEAVLLGAALPRPCARHAVELEPRKRCLPVPMGVDAADRKALQTLEGLLPSRAVEVLHPDGKHARCSRIAKMMDIRIPAAVRKAGRDGSPVRRLLFDFQKRALAVAHGDAERIVDERLIPRERRLHEAVHGDPAGLLPRGEEGKPDRRLPFVPFDRHLSVTNGRFAEHIRLIKHDTSKNTGQYTVPPRPDLLLQSLVFQI